MCLHNCFLALPQIERYLSALPVYPKLPNVEHQMLAGNLISDLIPGSLDTLQLLVSYVSFRSHLRIYMMQNYAKHQNHENQNGHKLRVLLVS